MRFLLYAISAVLFAVWAAAVWGWGASGAIHVVLILGIIAILWGLIHKS